MTYNISDLRKGYLISLDDELQLLNADGLISAELTNRLPFMVDEVLKGSVKLSNSLFPDLLVMDSELEKSGFKIQDSSLDTQYMNPNGTYRVSLDFAGNKNKVIDMTREELDDYRSGTRLTGLIWAGVGLLVGAFYFFG